MHGQKTKILVVINSFQRSKDLVERSLLRALHQNPAPWHVTFIDQNTPPLELDHTIKSDPIFEHVLSKSTCVSKARNELKVPPDTDWIVFCDDDGFLQDGYLQQLHELLASNSQLEIIAGSIKRDDNQEFYSPRHQIGGNLNYFRHTKLLMGSNFCVRARVFQELGGFDEQFGAGAYWGSGEETDFAWKAHFAGKNMIYSPELVVFHIKPYAGTFKHSFNKAFKYGLGKGALVGKWLFTKTQWKVIYELLEMFCVPFIQIVVNLLKFNIQMVLINLSTIAGRIFGLIKYFFKSNKTCKV